MNRSTDELLDALREAVRRDVPAVIHPGEAPRLLDIAEGASRMRGAWQFDRDEIERLRQWKNEAMVVLAEWDLVWIAAGEPGRLGGSKARAVMQVLEERRETL